MTRPDDPWGMDADAAEWTDLDVERVVRGAADDEVPAGLEDTAALFRAARGPAEGTEVDDRLGAATALASTTAVLAFEERPAWWRAAPRQVAIAAVAGVMLLSGVAAAATHGLGSHPAGPVTSNAPIDATHSAEETTEPSTVPSTSIDDSTSVPDSEPPSSTLLPSTTVASGDHGVGPLAIGPALRGLCTAFADRTVPPGSSVAYRNLAEAAAAAGEAIHELCAGVLPSDGNAQGNGNGNAQPGVKNTPVTHAGVPPGKAKGRDGGTGNGKGHGGD